MTNWKKFKTRFGQADVTFVHDGVTNGQVNGLLRALPAIQYAGLDIFTYPKSWRQLEWSKQFGLTDHEWRHMDEVTVDEPLGLLTLQFYEDERSVFSIKSLLDRGSTAGTLVVVADTDQFQPDGARRPLAEDPLVDYTAGYTDVYDAFVDWYRDAGLSMPLANTKNLFLQDNALLHERVTGNRITDIETLFDRLPDAPYLPLVAGLTPIFQRQGGLGAEPLSSVEQLEALGKWLRRRIELDYQAGLRVARLLNDYASEHEQLFDPGARRRMPAMHDARTARQELETQTPIHQRYHNWLTRALNP